MTTEDTENTEEKEEEKPRHPDGCRQDERHENKKIEEAHGQEAGAIKNYLFHLLRIIDMKVNKRINK